MWTGKCIPENCKNLKNCQGLERECLMCVIFNVVLRWKFSCFFFMRGYCWYSVCLKV